MCGINAIFKYNQKQVDLNDITLMSSAIQHRGPDEAGYALLNDGSLGFGHVRLSIIDLKTGQQPMFNDDGTIGLIFNGEIYDHKALREDLQVRGHHFKTTSDSEVIIRLYEEYDLNFFEKLNGEFAFIIWDQNKRRLLAVKDRMGIKPLFFYRSHDEIIFSSEAKGIFALPRVPRQISKEYLTGPAWGVFPKSFSTFESIESLKPGHFLIVNQNESPVEKEYWRLNYTPDCNLTFEDAQEKLRNLLAQAVKRRMVADVEVGVYLSGGLDSTLICALMAQNGQKFKAFNMGFTGSVYDEASLAQKIANHYGVQFETIDCSMELMAENYLKTIYHSELVLFNPGPIAKIILSHLVRSQNHKACLTGEGSDEIFGGYPYYKLEKIRQLMLGGGEEARLAEDLWKKFKIIDERSEGVLWDGKKYWKGVEPLFDFPSFHHARAHDADKYIDQAFNPELKLGEDNKPGTLFDKTYGINEIKNLNSFNITRSTSMNKLSGYLIPAYCDRMEMANSVECRTPFLDRDMLNFAGTLLPKYCLNVRELKEKFLLREAFKDVVPSFMKTAHKHPFMSPNWYTFSKVSAGKTIVDEFLSRRKIKSVGIFNPAFVRNARLLWKILPQRTLLFKRVDILIGQILGIQTLHHLFVENAVPASSSINMVDRTPAPRFVP